MRTEDEDMALRSKLAGPLHAAAPAPREGLMDDARAAVRARDADSRRFWIPAMAAGVAGLAIGAGLTGALRQPAGLPVTPDMAARGVLAAALTETPSGGRLARGAAEVSPLYTVAAADGRTCRAFRGAAGETAYEGAACRDGVGWRVLVLARAARAAGGFEQASGDEPPAVTAAVDALQPGEPLDPAAERALIARGWVGE